MKLEVIGSMRTIIKELFVYFFNYILILLTSFLVSLDGDEYQKSSEN